MKNNKITLVLLGFSLIFIVSSCKKNIQKNSNELSSNSSTKLSAGEIKCKGYVDLIHKKVREDVSRSEAVEYIEGAINYLYCRQYNYYTNRKYFSYHYSTQDNMRMEDVNDLYDLIISDLHKYRLDLNDETYWPALVDLSLSEEGGINVKANFVQVSTDIPSTIPTPSSSDAYKNTSDVVCSGTPPFSIPFQASASGTATLWYWDQWVNWPTNTPAGPVFPSSITQYAFGGGTMVPNPNWVGSNPHSQLITWTGTGVGSDIWKGECMNGNEVATYSSVYTPIYVNYLMSTSGSPVYQKSYLGQSYPPTYSNSIYTSPDDYWWFGGILYFGVYYSSSIPPIQF